MKNSDDLPDFEMALRAVAAHMSKDETLPILAGVIFRDGRLMATDRYTAARASFAPIGDLKPGRDRDVFLPSELVKFILSRQRDEVINVKTKGDIVTVSFASGITYTVTAPAIYSLNDTRAYPPVENLFDEYAPCTTDKPAPVRFALGRENVAKFAGTRMGRLNGDAMLIEPSALGGNKPVRITFRSQPWLEALCVPVRLFDEEN